MKAASYLLRTYDLRTTDQRIEMLQRHTERHGTPRVLHALAILEDKMYDEEVRNPMKYFAAIVNNPENAPYEYKEPAIAQTVQKQFALLKRMAEGEIITIDQWPTPEGTPHTEKELN